MMAPQHPQREFHNYEESIGKLIEPDLVKMGVILHPYLCDIYIFPILLLIYFQHAPKTSTPAIYLAVPLHMTNQNSTKQDRYQEWGCRVYRAK